MGRKPLNKSFGLTTSPENEETAQLKKELAELKKTLQQLKNTTDISKTLENTQEEMERDEFDNIKINQDDYIKVISLCPMQLNLSTAGMGKGAIFTFKHFGEAKRIIYSDLVRIMESHRNFLEEGFFYIADRRVVRRHGLDEAYANILTQEKIESIISANETSAVDLLKVANDAQKKFIADLLIDRMVKGIKVDLNVVDKITRLSGIDISSQVNEVNQYFGEKPNTDKVPV